MDSERVVSIHSDSYEKFWLEIFPSMLEASLTKVLDNCRDKISFSPKISDLGLGFHQDIPGDTPEALCQKWNLDYTQSVSCRIRLDQHTDPKTIHLGRIPKKTREGNFIINGKERSVIAQLIKSPDLTFHRDKVARRYASYSVEKIRYSARVKNSP